MDAQVRKDNKKITAYGEFPAGLSPEVATTHDLVDIHPEDVALVTGPGLKTLKPDGRIEVDLAPVIAAQAELEIQAALDEDRRQRKQTVKNLVGASVVQKLKAGSHDLTNLEVQRLLRATAYWLWVEDTD